MNTSASTKPTLGYTDGDACNRDGCGGAIESHPSENCSCHIAPTKIDYRIEMHSSASQKVIGVYPEGTTPQEVEARVKGTFGGRFNSFKDGRFEYIAYTD